MENLLPFVYGILTCGIIGAVAYGIYQIRELTDNVDDIEMEFNDLQAKHNILEREFEAKLDTLSNAIVGVDEKLDRIYKEAGDSIGERFEELENELEELTK